MDLPSNIAGYDLEGKPIPFKCAECLRIIFPLLKDDIVDACYYDAESKGWYCSKHWQDLWRDKWLPKNS